jgi:hypothetical protein
MVARIAGSMVVCVAVLIVVSFLVSFGMLRGTGSVLASVTMGTMCGLAAAFAVNSLGAAVRRTGEPPGRENDPSSSGEIADRGRPGRTRDGADSKGSQM